ncbi:hypothetical protein P8C59_007079 [Phyllachora maydis]|uniref:Uncharacterized protein n=1 Tax=Phyllachora maydis TaxID=1825666 RepID=A0AAD9I9D9_9PEZI|nr:hypothetical protein P8C59_007079 [Phyllachora maydis]
MADKSSEDDALFSEEDAAEPTAAAALTDRDSDEDELERLVLGGKASFREALFRDEFTADSLALVAAKAEDAKEAGGPEDLDDAALFIVDTAGVAEQAVTPTKNEKDSAAAAQDTPAWVDSDDERLTISLASVAQRRKLRVAEGEDLISGTEYVERLRKQYVQLYPVPGRRYLHIWNLSSGIVKKVTSIQGHRKEQKTMERFRLSPCGRYMALIATDRKGGGMLNILSVSSMQWIAQARVNGRGGIADFAWWSNGDGLTILGRDGHVAEWTFSTQSDVLAVGNDVGKIRINLFMPSDHKILETDRIFKGEFYQR